MFSQGEKTSVTFLKLTFVEVSLLYNVVLASTIQQSKSAICVHISTLFWIPVRFWSPQSTECYIALQCYTVDIYISFLLST